MKMVKSLILGSAAGLIAVGGAQAADLPVKAKAVEYVRICSLYGAGFYYIPGTDTCIKLGGYLRVEVVVNTNERLRPGVTHGRWRREQPLHATPTPGAPVKTSTSIPAPRPNTAWFAPSRSIHLDHGTQLARHYTGQHAPLGNAGGGVAVALGVYYAFIQFAGFTMGKAVSQFSAPWTNYPGNNFDGLVGGGDGHGCQPVRLHR